MGPSPTGDLRRRGAPANATYSPLGLPEAERSEKLVENRPRSRGFVFGVTGTISAFALAFLLFQYYGLEILWHHDPSLR